MADKQPERLIEVTVKVIDRISMYEIVTRSSATQQFPATFEGGEQATGSWLANAVSNALITTTSSLPLGGIEQYQDEGR